LAVFYKNRSQDLAADSSLEVRMLFRDNTTEDKQEPNNWLARRKGLKKVAGRQYPGRPLGWVGGILYFLDTKLDVPGVESVTKSGQEVKGWQANQEKDTRSRSEKRGGGRRSYRSSKSSQRPALFSW